MWDKGVKPKWWRSWTPTPSWQIREGLAPQSKQTQLNDRVSTHRKLDGKIASFFSFFFFKLFSSKDEFHVKLNEFNMFRARLVHMFKNWKLLFENTCENTCGWKSIWKYVECCLKTKNGCLKIQTKHPLS